MSETVVLNDVSPFTRGFSNPAYVRVRIEDVKVAGEWCKGRMRGEDAMTGLSGDFVGHVAEIVLLVV